MSLNNRISELERSSDGRPQRDITLRVTEVETVLCEESGERADIPVPCDEWNEGEYRSVPSGDRVRVAWPKPSQ